jgi:hypothetical protein
MRYADARCTYTETYTPEHTYTFTGPCAITGKPYSVTVPAAGLFAYRQGAYIQDAFPDLPAGDREFLMSGISPEAFDSMFGNPFEDDDDGDDDETGPGTGDTVGEDHAETTGT